MELNTFESQSVVDSFKSVLPQLYACKGVILDIRNNMGGSTDVGAEILKYFTEDKVLVGSGWQTRDNLSAYKAWGIYKMRDTAMRFDKLDTFYKKAVLTTRGDYWYKGDASTFTNEVIAAKITVPLIVLQGNLTGSAAEDFLVILDGLKGRAVTMGQTTYGSTGMPMSFDLPGGGTARICTKRDTYPDGREFVGTGIKPAITISRSIGDVLTGSDVELAAALKEINKMIK